MTSLQQAASERGTDHSKTCVPEIMATLKVWAQFFPARCSVFGFGLETGLDMGLMQRKNFPSFEM